MAAPCALALGRTTKQLLNHQPFSTSTEEDLSPAPAFGGVLSYTATCNVPGARAPVGWVAARGRRAAVARDGRWMRPGPDPAGNPGSGLRARAPDQGHPAVSVGRPLGQPPQVSHPGIPGLLPACRTKEYAVGLANRQNGPGAVSVGQRIVHWPIKARLEGSNTSLESSTYQ